MGKTTFPWNLDSGQYIALGPDRGQYFTKKVHISICQVAQ